MAKSKKTRTVIVTNQEMLQLYNACKRVMDLLWKHRKDTEIIFEYLDFQTMGEFCTTLSLANAECSSMLDSFRSLFNKYDFVFPELEQNKKNF